MAPNSKKFYKYFCIYNFVPDTINASIKKRNERLKEVHHTFFWYNLFVCLFTAFNIFYQNFQVLQCSQKYYRCPRDVLYELKDVQSLQCSKFESTYNQNSIGCFIVSLIDQIRFKIRLHFIFAATYIQKHAGIMIPISVWLDKHFRFTT